MKPFGFFLLIFLGACSMESSANTTPSELFFPQQKESEEQMESLLSGELIVMDSCLRVNDREIDLSYLLIWPHDFTLDKSGEVPRVLNSNGEMVAEVGMMIDVGGGEFSEENQDMLEEMMIEPLPMQCSGPYWVVGELLSSS